MGLPSITELKWVSTCIQRMANSRSGSGALDHSISRPHLSWLFPLWLCQGTGVRNPVNSDEKLISLIVSDDWKSETRPVFLMILDHPCSRVVKPASRFGVVILITLFDDDRCLCFFLFLRFFSCTNKNKHSFSPCPYPSFLVFCSSLLRKDSVSGCAISMWFPIV